MSDILSETPRSFGRNPAGTSTEVNGVANAPAVALSLHDEGHPFELPARLFEQLPFMFVTGTGWFSDTTVALPNYGTGRLRLAIPMNDFADRIECTAPTAVCSRIMRGS
jgi:hypothetical protein